MKVHGLFVAMCGLSLVAASGAVASLATEHRLKSAQASVVVVHGLSCPAACGIFVPRPGIQPVFSELADGFLSTVPPGEL